MLIQDKSPASAPAAVSGTSQKLLQLLRKRLRQLAGHVRLGDRPCAGRHGSCNLVADESERTPRHRRAIRCRGVPRLQHSRRSECLHISSASGRGAHPHARGDTSGRRVRCGLLVSGGPEVAGDIDVEALPGALIYIKPSLSGDERSDAHLTRRPPDFPHESPANQFFSESQFERYHELGKHHRAGRVRRRGARCRGRLQSCRAFFQAPPPMAPVPAQPRREFCRVHEAVRKDPPNAPPGPSATGGSITLEAGLRLRVGQESKCPRLGNSTGLS